MSPSLHFLTNSLFAVVCIVMGASFLSLPIPKNKRLQSYKISIRVLASAYFVMGLLTVAVLVFNLADNSREYFTFLAVFISSTQALLFTFSLITLLDPDFVGVKNIIYHCFPYVVFLILYSTSFSLFGDPVLISLTSVAENFSNPTVWVRLLFLGYYLFQLIYYTHLFLFEARKYNNELLDFFSDVYQLKLNWVYIAFFSALTVGTISMISNFLPASFDWMVTLSFAIFYFAFAQEYIKYNKVFKIIEPAITLDPVEIQPTIQPLRIKTEWNSYKKEIIDKRYYCETGITIEDLAQKLKIGRTTLSNFINREEGVNFNTWINKLRIDEAKQILINNPDLPLVYVAEHVGFTEQSNFSRQFKLLTGESPMVWKKSAVAS